MYRAEKQLFLRTINHDSKTRDFACVRRVNFRRVFRYGPSPPHQAVRTLRFERIESEPQHVGGSGRMSAQRALRDGKQTSGQLAKSVENDPKRTSLALSISAASKRPTSYSITSSAATRRFCGTVRPSVLAILRLMTNSNLVDCMTGSSVGFSPLRIRPV